MVDIQEEAADLHETLPDDIDDTVDDIADKIQDFVEHGVGIEDAKNSIRSNHGVSTGNSMDADPVDKGCGELDTDNEPVNMTAKVIQQWDPRSDSVHQVGLLGDETGTAKFIEFVGDDNNPIFEEDSVIEIEKGQTDEYEGNFSVTIQDSTTVTVLDGEDVEVSNDGGGESLTLETAALVDVRADTSGLIKRCPEEDCTRVLTNGRCGEHGEVDGEFDLRIKAIADDGNASHTVYFNEELTEELTGIDLEEAQEIASEELDQTAVIGEMIPMIQGRYYTLEVTKYDRSNIVNEFEEASPDTEAEADALLEQMEA